MQPQEIIVNCVNCKIKVLHKVNSSSFSWVLICNCGLNTTYCYTECCKQYTKICDISINTMDYYDTLFKCKCGLRYLYFKEMDKPGYYCRESQINHVVLANYTRYLDRKNDEKINKLEKNLTDKIDNLTLKLSRLLEMVEFSPDGGPAAVAAEASFNSGAKINDHV